MKFENVLKEALPSSHYADNMLAAKHAGVDEPYKVDWTSIRKKKKKKKKKRAQHV